MLSSYVAVPVAQQLAIESGNNYKDIDYTCNLKSMQIILQLATLALPDLH